ncbi:MAG: penicillin-binding protein 2 [Dehalococcoidia bacterium]
MTLFDDRGRSGGGPSRTRPHGNLTFLRVAIVVLFSILTLQLVNLQIINGEDYARRAEENHITTTNIVPPRGLIYDANGTVLVQNIGLYTATLTPDFLPEEAEARFAIYLRMEDLTGAPALEIQALVETYADRPWTNIPVKQGLTREQALILEEASVDLPGVSLTITPARDYLADDSLSHVLGYIGLQDAEDAALLRGKGYQLTEMVGKSGVEGQYEAILRGQPGTSQNEVDAFGRLITALNTEEPTPGSSIKLSIDAELQEYVASVLRLYQGDAPTAAAVVMDANTGEILALVSLPTYPNEIFEDLSDPANQAAYQALSENTWGRPLVNHAISDQNIPGSVFKLVTATAGLEEGVITPEFGVNVPTRVLEQRDINGDIFTLVDWRAHGYLDLRGAISWSSNIYFYNVACGLLDESVEGLGATRLGTWARNFGFGSKTGIDLSGESAGRVPSPEWKRQYFLENFGREEDWFYGNTCFFGIGQEYITASPLQVARMTAVVANGGRLVTPHVVSEVIAPDGTVQVIEAPTKQVPVDPASLQVVREGMRLSASSGAAARSASDYVVVAGKTGTAEFKLGPNGEFLNHAWYTGFAPYDDPEIVVAVFFELGWGGDKGAPAAQRIFDYYFSQVAPR